MIEVLTHEFDFERFFEHFPIPKKYDNKDTRIQFLNGIRLSDFQIVIANPNLPPLVWTGKKWRKLNGPKQKG